MKYTKIYIIPVLLAFLGLAACQDDYFNEYKAPEAEGIVDVNLCVDYMPMANTVISSRAADGTTDGDVMDDVRDMCIVVFDTDGKCVYLTDVENTDYTDTEVQRDDADASNGQLAGETTTLRRNITMKLEAGRYYMYAVSNLGDKTSGQSTYTYLKGLLDNDQLSRTEFRTLSRKWDAKNISNNSEMAGYFTQNYRSGSSFSSSNISDGTVNVQPGTRLYCWMRRLASKLTVDFDATLLDASTTIYLKDIRVRDIAYDSPLIEMNAADETVGVGPGGLLDEENDNKQVMKLCYDQHYNGSPEQLHTNWPAIAAGHPTLADVDGFADRKAVWKNMHGHTAQSLFFYENMQGEGVLKQQDAGVADAGGNIASGSQPDGIIDSPDSTDPADPDFKDRKRAGTYVEVRAYYESTAVGNEGHGEITYRFMLGANAVNDYNVERNHHYKLTLVFKGYANDYDWHIEYDRAKAPITIPNPYYISYGYNESLELPITVQGEIVDNKVEATILRNDWWPSKQWVDEEAEAGTHLTRSAVLYSEDDVKAIKATRASWAKKLKKNYPDGLPKALNSSDQTYNEGVSIGFLSLRRPHGDVVGSYYSDTNDKSYSAANSRKYHWKIWQGECDLPGDESNKRPSKAGEEKRTLGYRTYNVAGGNGTTIYNTGYNSDEEDGEYRIIVNKGTANIPKTTTMYLPLYTRQRNIIKTMSYTGENPYNAYQRRAQVLYSFKVRTPDNETIDVDTIIDIVQVCKIGNPTGVWRSWDNASPFEVTLKLPESDYSDKYRNLKSRGGWSAEVEYGQDWIILNGGKRKIYGGNMSDIEFTYRPAGILMNDTKVRCGIILVKYHNYTCSHRIFVRQGYAPIKIHDDGVYWHSYNMVTKDTPGISPLDEGSMFRYGVWDYPIDSSEAVDDGFKAHSTTEFTIAGKDEKLTWDKIKNNSINSTYPWDFDNVKDGEFEFNGVKCRLMSIEDICNLRDGGDNHDTRYQYGVLYGDETQRTASYTDRAWGYRASDPSTHSYGMRGCFVYHRGTGRQIFFPIGASGYGHRKRHVKTGSGPEAGPGVLRYCAGRTGEMPASVAQYMAHFFDLYRRPGAIYWSNDHATDPVLGQIGYGLDLNYFTFDFNTIAQANIYNDGVGWDACFIRLVQESAPQ